MSDHLAKLSASDRTEADTDLSLNGYTYITENRTQRLDPRAMHFDFNSGNYVYGGKPYEGNFLTVFRDGRTKWRGHDE